MPQGKESYGSSVTLDPYSPRLYALFGLSAPALPEGAGLQSWLVAGCICSGKERNGSGATPPPLVQRGVAVCAAGGIEGT